MELREEFSPEGTVGFFNKKMDFSKDDVPLEDEPYMKSAELACFFRRRLSWGEEIVAAHSIT
jgi:hypothetical protein